MAAANLGVAHPPGYPLFVLLGKLATLVPFGTLAYRIHLFNALLATCSAGILMAIGRQLSLSLIAQIAAATFLVFGPNFASQGLTAEVYMLNLFIFSLLFLLSLQLGAEPRRSRLMAFAFVLGLGLCNHWPLLLLALPGFGPLLWPVRKRIIENLPFIMPAFIVGLTPYIHLFVAHHYSDYIFIDPITSLESFWHYVSRKEYRGYDQAQFVQFQDLFAMSADLLFMHIRQLSYLGFVVAVLGLIRIAKEKWQVFFLLLWAILSCSVILMIFRQSEYSLLGIEFFKTFQLQAVFAFCLAFALGIEKFLSHRPMATTTALIIVLSCHIIIGVVAIRKWIDAFPKDYAEMIFDLLPQNSVVLVKTDADASLIAYGHDLEGRRSDLLVTSQVSAFLPKKIFSRTNDIPDGSHKKKLIRFIDEHLKQGRRVFSMGELAYFDKRDLPFHAIPYGIFVEIQKDKAANLPLGVMANRAAVIADRYRDGAYGKRWLGHRQTLIANICHLFLLAGKEHPILAREASCQRVSAQFYNSRRIKLREANKYFLLLIGENRPRTFKERSHLYREYLVNSHHLIQSQKGTKPIEDLVKEYQNPIDLVAPFIKKFPHCESTVALNYYQIALQMPVKVDWDFYNEHYSRCPWAQLLKPLLRNNP